MRPAGRWLVRYLVSVAGAAAASATLQACAASPVQISTQCPPLATYTPAQQQALAAAVQALPDGSPLVSAMLDYGQLRAADRACQGVSP